MAWTIDPAVDRQLDAYGRGSIDLSNKKVSYSNEKQTPDGASSDTNWGRMGDTKVAHVTDGEIVVPRSLLDTNPEIGIAIQNALAGIGEDPSRYVVGEDNSINPYTGQPEFWSWNPKDWVKSAVKAVNKIPIVGNVILPAAAMAVGGPAAAAAVSAAQTKIQGGSWGQAVGSAVGSYLGSKIGGPELGQGANGTITTSLSNAGTKIASDNLLGTTLSSTLNEGLQWAAESLPNSIGNQTITSLTGAYLGSNIGSALGASVDPPETQTSSIGSNVIPLPTNQYLSTGTLSLPSASDTSTGSSKGSGYNASVPSAKYLTTVTDRDTGEKKTVNGTFAENFDTGRRQTWGSSVSFA